MAEESEDNHRERGQAPISFLDAWTDQMMSSFTLGMRMMGLAMSAGLYVLVSIHVYAYFTCLPTMLQRRLGDGYTLIWMGIGLALVYNICYNHFFAMMIKPGSIQDVKRVEQLRVEYKKDMNRREVKVDMDDNTEDERFTGVSQAVKRLVRYRNKSVD